MKAVITPSTIKGSIMAPSSKSHFQRACAAALIRKGETVLHFSTLSEDDNAALSIIQQLGAEVKQEEAKITIISNGIAPITNEINCGESGLSARMFTPLAALSDRPITITGKGSLLKRPFSFFDEVLPQLNVGCTSNNGHLPLQIKGPLKPHNITIDGSLSSQYLTGLLMAYSACNARDVTITVTNLTSKPYIDLTLQVLKDFGLPTPLTNNYESFTFTNAPINRLTNKPINLTIEADWSSASFLLVAAAIAGNIELRGLNVFSQQADKNILHALSSAGVTMSIQEDAIEVKASKLKAFHFNATDCPDLFPPLVALAAYCEGTSVIEGTTRLIHKESNRALSLQQEFSKLGVTIKLQDDLMIIEGAGEIKAATVSSHNDHRVAMACAVAALRSTGEVTIEGAESVDKSYPLFWHHLQQLGASVSLAHN